MLKVKYASEIGNYIQPNDSSGVTVVINHKPVWFFSSPVGFQHVAGRFLRFHADSEEGPLL